MFDTINKKLSDEHFIQSAIEMTEASTKADQISSDSEAGMSDKDTACYNNNYADVGGADKARDHY